MITQQYAEVAWTIEDIQDASENRGERLTEREAEEFILNNQNLLRDRLIELGWDIINDLLINREADIKNEEEQSQ